MSTTALQTITDALIEFILSLLRDPDALAEFEADPEQALADHGLTDVCGEDVRSVTPVIVDRPDVALRPPAKQPPPPDHPGDPSPMPSPGPPPGSNTPQDPPPVVVVNQPPEVVEEITRVTNAFHIDNRSTIVDQSVNQSIWAEGDVMQLFDQEAVLALGDDSMAAGEDAIVDSSDSDVTVGDVAVGNTETTNRIENSFNDESLDVRVGTKPQVEDSFNDESVDVDVDVDTDIDDSFNDSIDVDVASEVEGDGGGADVEDSIADSGDVEVDPAVADSFDVDVDLGLAEAAPEAEYDDTPDYASVDVEAEEYVEMESDEI